MAEYCQLKDFYHDKRECVFGILKAMKNEKKFIKNELFQNLGLNCNNIVHKLPEQFQRILLRFSREFNHTRFNRKVILT